MSTYEGSRQFLQKESGDGVSLYDHLANVLLKVRQIRSPTRPTPCVLCACVLEASVVVTLRVVDLDFWCTILHSSVSQYTTVLSGRAMRHGDAQR